ncbi:MAG: metallophosphoesterase [Gemmatimonadetes bacterium]|nr:metallophosphoesterase [Gemmatimonadota bacterium]
MSVRLVHIADVHLGAPLANFGDYARQRRSEQQEAFRRAVDAALAARAQVVVIAGDFFDTFRPEPAAVELARRELGRLEEAGVKVFGVPGTHDSLGYAECVYRHESLPFHHFFDRPTFEDPVRLEVEGVPVTIYGIAYDPRRTGGGWKTLSRTGEEGIHVAVVHAACRFNPEWPIAEEDLPFLERELSGFGMDYIALGHYHNLRIFEAGGRVVGAYSGSLEGRDWTERGPRHVLVVEWDEPGAAPTVRPVEVHSRLMDVREVDVTGAADEEEMIAAVESACDAERLWKATLVGEPEVIPRPRTIEASLASRYGHLRVEDRTSMVASHVLEQRREEETVRGEFFRRLVDRRETAEGRTAEVVDRAIKLGLRVFG